MGALAPHFALLLLQACQHIDSRNPLLATSSQTTVGEPPESGADAKVLRQGHLMTLRKHCTLAGCAHVVQACEQSTLKTVFENTGFCLQVGASQRWPRRKSKHRHWRTHCAQRTSCGRWSTTWTSMTSCSPTLTRGRLCAYSDAATAPSRRAWGQPGKRPCLYARLCQKQRGRLIRASRRCAGMFWSVLQLLLQVSEEHGQCSRMRADLHLLPCLSQ